MNLTLDLLHRDNWQRGWLLAFSALDGTTDYEHGLVARTVSGGVEVCLPEKCPLRFDTGGGGVFGGDFFSVSGAAGKITRGVLVDAHHLLIEGACAWTGENPAGLKIAGSGGRMLIGSGQKFNAALLGADFDVLWRERSRWLLSQEIPASLSPSAARTLARALTVMKSQVCSPERKFKRRWTTPDRWPHRDAWLWDTAFHAVGWRHVDVALAAETLDAMFAHQRADGFLTYRGTPLGSSDYLGETVTQPPVLALAAGLVFEKSGDRDWLQNIYPRLATYVEWDLQHRDTDGDGLLKSYIEDDPNCRSSETGMDNSPRFDRAAHPANVDFNAYAARECEVLAELALTLGRAADADRWRSRHRRLCALMREKLWSAEHGFYFDRELSSGRHIETWTSTGFLPLFCGAATGEQACRLAALLNDPRWFGAPLPVPSIAANDPAYAKDMWRGPVWVNVNWMIAAGFERYGMREEAARIREATVSEIENYCESHGTFFEYYDDRREVAPPLLLRKGELNPDNPYRQVIHDYGWTTTLYVDLLQTMRHR
ncbi:MAG: hypothetical protein LBK60_02305 [Verrucomicrobiales bacterium]|jgi:hypothetical protein|nr:hypothetical protein [Verrucomicrobiales bacterium]